jgi:protein SCO1/2
MPASRRRSAGALTALSCALATALIASCGGSPTTPATSSESAGAPPGASGFAGAALPPEAAHGFTLLDQHGRTANAREYTGHVVVLAFLATHCGAPCVVIAQQIRGALDQLGAPVPVLLVSVDPSGDTRASIARFLAGVSLTGRARYLRGPRVSLEALWRDYHVPAPARGSSAFERFAPVVLLDREGRARVAYALEGLTPESLAHDIRALSR